MSEVDDILLFDNLPAANVNGTNLHNGNNSDLLFDLDLVNFKVAPSDDHQKDGCENIPDTIQFEPLDYGAATEVENMKPHVNSQDPFEAAIDRMDLKDAMTFDQEPEETLLIDVDGKNDSTADRLQLNQSPCFADDYVGGEEDNYGYCDNESENELDSCVAEVDLLREIETVMEPLLEEENEQEGHTADLLMFTESSCIAAEMASSDGEEELRHPSVEQDEEEQDFEPKENCASESQHHSKQSTDHEYEFEAHDRDDDEDEHEEEEEEKDESDQVSAENVTESSLDRAYYQNQRQQHQQIYTPSSSVPAWQKVSNERSAAAAATPLINGVPGGDESCVMCNKRVYQMEKLTADQKIYHKTCFKCFKCLRTLDVRTYAVSEGQLYCKPHFMELFKLRGHYQDRSTLIVNGAVTAENTSSNSKEPAVEQMDLVKAEDKINDGIEAVPSLRNLRSRFETANDNSSNSPSKQKKSAGLNHDVQDNNADARQVYYAGLENAKTKYEKATAPRVSKQSHGVKDITPPPDSGIKESHPRERDPNIVRHEDGIEDAMPPPAVTKNLLAKFKELEQSGAASAPAPVAPQGRRKSSRSTDHNFNNSRQHHQSTKGEPVATERARNTELAENSPQQRHDVIRESDQTEILPEPGTTKNVLNLWRAKEDGAGGDSALIMHKPTLSTNHGGVVDVHHFSIKQRVVLPELTQDVEQLNSEATNVVRESDGPAEDEFPPPHSAAQRLAIFRQMEANGHGPVAPSPESAAKQAAKAREASGVNRNVRLPFNQQTPPSITDSAENEISQHFSNETAENEPEQLPENVVRYGRASPDDEAPPLGTTRNLRALFQQAN